MLKERLEQDMRTALKEREAGKARLSVLRMALAAVKNLEIDKRRPLTDDEVVEVLGREVRGRRDVLPDYERAGRQELVEKIQGEIALLTAYLPEQISAAEVEEIVRRKIEEVGATGPRDLGKVMGPLMRDLRGRVDGNLVQEAVKRLLGGA